MIQQIIISDDLTGALDAGICFVESGCKTKVLFSKQISKDDFINDAMVLVVDAESRHLSPKEAYKRVRGITQTALNAGVNKVFIKTDSALRGNVGASLAALYDVSPSKRVLK